MPDQKCPEEIVKAANKASETLDRAASGNTLSTSFKASSSGSYEFPQKQAVLPFISQQSFSLPPDALQQMQKWKPGNAAGILPEISRAYFAVDNVLYFWDYIERKDVTTYEDTYPIVGVALVKAKNDIFNPSITHVLVIATTQQISLAAVSFTPVAGKAPSVTFYQTHMFTPSSGELMTTIIGTKHGRIFMLSNAGRVWELEYRREEGWFTSKCTKRARPGASSYSYLLGATYDPCTAIATDAEGRILYQVYGSATIQVTYLGEDGNSFTHVAKQSQICASAHTMCPASPFIDSNSFKIVSIHPTTSVESKTYQLVAVTSTGCRLYFSHYKYGSEVTANMTPNALELVHVRTPPVVLQGPISNQPVISKCLYKDSVFLFAEKKGNEQYIGTACPNTGKMVVLGNDISFCELSNRLPSLGEALEITEIPGVPFKFDDLATLPGESARHFLVFTTCGMSIISKQRPVDMLQNMLAVNPVGSSIQSTDFISFFTEFGAINSCALCFNLVCSIAELQVNAAIPRAPTITTDVVKGATHLLETLGQTPSNLNAAYTSRHDGLALFVSRVISPMWKQRIFVQKTVDGKPRISNAIPRNMLLQIQQVLRKLQAFMDINVAIHPQMEPQTAEELSLTEIYGLVVLISEAISFILFLVDNDTTKIISSLTSEANAQLLALTFKNLLTTDNGRSLTTDLTNGIIDENMARFSNMDIVVDILEQRCGSFCSASDALLYKAIKQIENAKSKSPITPPRNALYEASQLLKRIAIHIPYEKLRDIVKVYASQGELTLAVELVLACAKARDPQNITTTYVQDNFPENDPRVEYIVISKKFYELCYELLKEAVQPSYTASVSAVQKNQAFQRAFQSDDLALHYYVYNQLIIGGFGNELIKVAPPHLEAYLNLWPDDPERMELLANYKNLISRQ
ncbi:Nup133 N terminal like-domain-containing protein [Dichotomocladium elegans]|nr:Nup133 N terminal like-domain-containing protein [Dichotomocladium elegans]